MIHFKDVAVLGQPCGYIFGGLGNIAPRNPDAPHLISCRENSCAHIPRTNSAARRCLCLRKRNIDIIEIFKTSLRLPAQPRIHSACVSSTPSSFFRHICILLYCANIVHEINSCRRNTSVCLFMAESRHRFVWKRKGYRL